MSTPPPQIKNRIWITRVKRGLSRKRLARLLGQKRSTHLLRWENGIKTPTLESALLLAHLLDTSVEMLFKDLRAEIIRAAGERSISNEDVILFDTERLTEADERRFHNH